MILYVQNSIFMNRKSTCNNLFDLVLRCCSVLSLFFPLLIKIDVIQIEYLVDLINMTFITI